MSQHDEQNRENKKICKIRCKTVRSDFPSAREVTKTMPVLGIKT